MMLLMPTVRLPHRRLPPPSPAIADIKKPPKVNETAVSTSNPAECLGKVVDWFQEIATVVSAMFPANQAGKLVWESAF